MSLFLAYLGIFVPVLAGGLAIGWLGRGLWEHRRRPQPDVAAEWAEVWRSVQDEMEGR